MPKSSLRGFDPYDVAKSDTLMWRAYYDHKFLRLTILLVKIIHSQFKLNWLRSIRAAFYSGRAAADFRRNRSSQDYSRVIEDLKIYYEYIEKHAVESFDPQKVAELEMKWWLVHRYPKRYKQSLEHALADAASALHDVPAKDLKYYARYHVEAMHIRDTATWQTKTEPDWEKIEGLLTKSFVALKKAVTN